jgi:hypothetical protein
MSKETKILTTEQKFHSILGNLVDQVLNATETKDADNVIQLPVVVKNMLTNMPWYSYKQMMYCKNQLDKIEHNSNEIEKREPNSIDLEAKALIVSKWETQHALWKAIFDMQEVCFLKVNNRSYEQKDLEEAEHSFKKPKAISNYRLEQKLTA